MNKMDVVDVMKDGANGQDLRDGKARYFLGIDVGSASARAGIFACDGRLMGSASRPISIRRPLPDHAEQSSAEIWAACCDSVRAALLAAQLPADSIAALGFDATCSLVVQDAAGRPLSIANDGAAERDIIMWMDHRAQAETDLINATGHAILARTGGRISVEMQLPKLLWLKRNLPDTWSRAAQFHDLPDWLVQRATGTQARSLCSLVCKWTYLGEKGSQGQGWDASFFCAIGLDDLADEAFSRLGLSLLDPGQCAGLLNETAAVEMGLPPGLPVAAGAIDAYAGAMGSLDARDASGPPLAERMALIAGTSACHIISQARPRDITGIWGPYYSVLLPGYWSHEGGQSAAGALIDRILELDPSSEALRQETGRDYVSFYALLEARLTRLAGSGDMTFLTRDLHVQPDFLGNRSPLADAARRGAISGLTLETGADWLSLAYLAGLQALAYGTRQIIEGHRAMGTPVTALTVSGGLARNQIYLQQHADATGCLVMVSDNPEPVLLGAAMLAAAASRRLGAPQEGSLQKAMGQMSGAVTVIAPRGGTWAAYHDRKYRVFRRMQSDFETYRDLMEGETE